MMNLLLEPRLDTLLYMEELLQDIKSMAESIDAPAEFLDKIKNLSDDIEKLKLEIGNENG